MKIYLFNHETGWYLGEDFADEAPLYLGEFVIPSDATPVAPPTVRRGEIPVFTADVLWWEVRSPQTIGREPGRQW
jgi:hypothetical protein